ncbi:MAG: hypothetical protein U0228_33210 [Myxococcaceae bacterium]
MSDAAAAKRGALGGPVAIVGLVIALGLSFWLGSEDHFPGNFYISRQAMWDGGKYYVKWTFMLVLLTLSDVFAVPLILFSGLRALWRSNEPAKFTPPPTWDTKQVGRRLKQVVGLGVASVSWAVFTGLAVFKPEVLDPLGFLAGLLLMIIPTMPMLIPAVLFDLLCPVKYLEGPVAVQVVQQGRNTTTYLSVAGERFTTSPAVAAGFKDGTPVRLMASGFFSSLLRVERMG